MNNRFLFYALAALAVITISLSACAQKKKATTGNRTSTNASSTKPERNNISYMAMKRTSCYGKCPTYDMEIYGNGLVRYKGRMFVEPLGVYEKNFNTDSIRKLLVRFQNARVDTMKNSYEKMVSDVPDLQFEFTINGIRKSIVGATFGPLILKELAGELDYFIGKPDFSWKRVATKVD